MAKETYNKLVRDNIPAIIAAKGKSVTIKSVKNDKEALLRALKDKLVEETFEVVNAKEPINILEELADVLQVVDDLAFVLGYSYPKIVEESNLKRHQKGNFLGGIILESVEDKS